MSAGGDRRGLASYLPTLSARSVARRLTRLADAARDARRWQVAAEFYEAALAMGSRGAIHVQCGNMLKEAGDLQGAERHYLKALRLMPDDADLALQIGHLHKTAGRLHEAEDAYRRAVALAPDLSDAAHELARIGGRSAESEASAADRDGPDRLVTELLPGVALRGQAIDRDEIVVRRLGIDGGQAGGSRRVLWGIQAIRGWATSATPLTELHLVVNGTILRSEPLHGLAGPTDDARRKYVFNLWHDFSACPLGEATVELCFLDARGRKRVHRSSLTIDAPRADVALLASDAFVPTADVEGGPAEARVDALSSVVRPAARAALADEPRSVLVQRIDQLGDLVCSVAAIRRLRALFPRARFVGLVSAANIGLAMTLGLFDEVVEVDFTLDGETGRRVMPAAAQRALRERLAPHAFDIAIDLSESGESRPVLLLSGARFLYGFGRHDHRWLSAGLDLAMPDPLDRLETSAPSRKLVALVEGLGALVRGRAPIVPRPGDDAARLLTYGIGPRERYVVLHTGARLRFSRWPGFPELARLLLERTDLRILVMRDEPGDEAFPLSEGRLRILTGRLPFDDFDALLANAAVVVVNDSGPKHLAALRGTKVVSLHMARLNWNEWGQEQTGCIISRRVPCAGCGIADRPEECGRDFACIRRIAPEEVLDAVLMQLAG